MRLEAKWETTERGHERFLDVRVIEHAMLEVMGGFDTDSLAAQFVELRRLPEIVVPDLEVADHLERCGGSAAGESERLGEIRGRSRSTFLKYVTDSSNNRIRRKRDPVTEGGGMEGNGGESCVGKVNCSSVRAQV